MNDNFEITSLTSRWQIAKGGSVLCFTAGLPRTMAKDEEYRKDFHNAEAILAHYRVDKPSKRFYQL